MTESGRRLVAVSDCGWAFVARLHYDEQGNLVGAFGGARSPPLTAPGWPAGPGRRRGCGEPGPGPRRRPHRGLRAAPSPVALPARLRALSRCLPDPLQVPPGSAALEPNQGFEAALALEDGRLLVLTEAPSGQPRTAAGWIERGAVWEAFDLPLVYAPDAPDEPFRPTALGLLPGGDVVVAERRYPPVAVRLRRIPRASLEAGRDLEGSELARFAPRSPSTTSKGSTSRRALTESRASTSSPTTTTAPRTATGTAPRPSAPCCCPSRSPPEARRPARPGHRLGARRPRA